MNIIDQEQVMINEICRAIVVKTIENEKDFDSKHHFPVIPVRFYTGMTGTILMTRKIFSGIQLN